MTPLVWLGAAGLLPWLVAAAFGGAGPEVFYGMLGPLAATCATWLVVERTYRVRPEALTSVMVGGVVVKAVFFAVYVVAVLRWMALGPVPFIASFTGYFVVLYGLEAVFLKRLFAQRTDVAR